MNTTKNNTKKMVLGVAHGNNFGYHDGAYTNIGATVEQVQKAERGGYSSSFSLIDFSCEAM